MKNIHLLGVLLLVVVVGGCVATQDFVREEVAASATALRGEMNMADKKLAGQIAEVAKTAEAGFKKTDVAIAGLKGQIAELGSRTDGLTNVQKKTAEGIAKIEGEVAAVGKKADTAIREAGVAQREAGVAKIQHRFPGGVRAYLITGFPVGKYELSDTQKKYIKTISDDPKNANFVVKGVLGFADRAPFPDKAKSDELNTELAEGRAKAVANEFLANSWRLTGTRPFEGEGPSEILGPRGYNRSVLVVVGPDSQATAAATSSAPPPPPPAAGVTPPPPPPQAPTKRP